MKINPQKIPLTKEEILKHRDNPSLVRHYVLNLPDGFSLFYFCSVVLKYDDLSPRVHGQLCHFLEHRKYGRFRDATVPRSWFKTSTATIGKSIWLPIKRDRNIRILIAMNTADNAQKRVHIIKHHWQSNTLLQQAFPELVPDFKHCRWSNTAADIKRTKYTEEATYEAIGVGGAVISRHYDHIIEDDLVYARKDDMTGAELQPNMEDIQKAIGWHKLVYSLFSDPKRSTLDNIGTRWAVHDLKDWIRTHERRRYRFFELSAYDSAGNPIWPERFSNEVLDDIRDSQGPYIFSTQYLNIPREQSEIVFQTQWLQFYSYQYEIPTLNDVVTVVDLAGWGDSKGKSRNVVLTIGMDNHEHCWILRYDRGKFNPSEVIDLMEIHAKQFNSRVRVEEVQYQRAIRHFAYKRREEKGFWYPLAGLPHDNSKAAKDARIRNIAHVAIKGALHIKTSMKEFIREYTDYPNGLTDDILDCVGWGIKLLNPKNIQQMEKKESNPFVLDNILEEIERKNRTNVYPIRTGLSTYHERWN